MIRALFLIILILTFASPVWATYIQRPEIVNVTTKDGLKTIVISAGGRAALTITEQKTVTFEWDANNEDVDGYYLYCTGPTEIKEQTTETQVTVTMDPGEYKCWATAYRGDEESGPSNNLSVMVE